MVCVQARGGVAGHGNTHLLEMSRAKGHSSIPPTSHCLLSSTQPLDQLCDDWSWKALS